MDQEKIGNFIAKCRKEKSLTQLELAEKLCITDRAVSKWERGKSLPDADIMIDLSNILGISVTELLIGERIKMEDYKKETEKEFLEVAKNNKESKAKLSTALTIILVISIATFLVMILPVALNCVDHPWNYILPIFGALILGIGTFTCITMEYKVGYYKCPHCGKVYVPTFRRYIISPNAGLKMWMKCPQCHKRGLHDKVFKK